jgi:hypothetical protein
MIGQQLPSVRVLETESSIEAQGKVISVENIQPDSMDSRIPEVIYNSPEQERTEANPPEFGRNPEVLQIAFLFRHGRLSRNAEESDLLMVDDHNVPLTAGKFLAPFLLIECYFVLVIRQECGGIILQRGEPDGLQPRPFVLGQYLHPQTTR